MPSFGVSATSPKSSLSFNMSPTAAIIFIKCRNRHHMKNNIRYKGNINNTSVIIFFFNWKTKTPSDVTLLGRTSSEVFVMLIVVAVLHFIFVLHFIVVLHSFCSSFCCCYSSFHCFLCDVDLLIAFQSHPSLFRGLSLGFYTHFILSAQPIAEWFATLSFPTFPRSSFHSFTASAIVLSRHFLPTGVFYLMLLHQHFICV